MSERKSTNGRDGEKRLIHACLAANELTAERIPAAERLDRELGQQQARRLVDLLTRRSELMRAA
jgi:hypothetical protein